jgi:hypothetical protein
MVVIQMHRRGREYQMRGNARAANRIQRRQALVNLVDTAVYTLPKRFSDKALSKVVNHPNIFSLPSHVEINERRRRNGFPTAIGQIAAGNLERPAPERRVAEDNDDLQVPDVGTFDPTNHSLKFSYEVLHLLYYQLPAAEGGARRRGTYLPFLSREPESKWIQEMIEAFDGRDASGIRTPFDVNSVMKNLERPDQLALDEVREAMPGFLNIPNDNGVRNFLDELGHLAGQLTRIRRGFQKSVRSCFKDVLTSIRQMTIATEETDFTLTRLYTSILDLRADIANALDGFAPDRAGAPNLVIHMLRNQLNRTDELLRSIPTKTLENNDLIDIRHDVFLQRSNPKVYDALKRCLGCPEGEDEFIVGGQMKSANNFMLLGYNQNLVSLCISSVMGGADNTLRYFIENNNTRPEVAAQLGIGGQQGLAEYCQQLSDTLPQGVNRDSLFRYCNGLDRHNPTIQQNHRFPLSQIIRCLFVRKYGQIDN